MKTCLTTTKIGTTIKLNNKIISGTPPYDVVIKKDAVELKSFLRTTTTEQETNYTTILSDKGTKRFSVNITDSCPTPKSASEYCDVEITEETTGDCMKLIIKPKTVGTFDILEKGFIIATKRVCGEIINDSINEPIQIWISIKVDTAPVNLKITVKLNFTDRNNTVQEIILQKTELIQVGTYEIKLISDKNYSIGKYDITEVKGEIL